MARVLHLVKGTHVELARATIERQLTVGDSVTVAILEGAPPPLPARVTLRIVGHDCTWDQLLDLLFAADHVVTW